MCAILDANCLDEVFGSGDRPEAGKKFFEWLEGQGSLVVGGKLREELGRHHRFSQWFREATLAGRITNVDNKSVEGITEELKKSQSCQSNDQHIIALAQVSKARLLYSKDKDLHRDFRNQDLVWNPRGKVYSTLVDGTFSKTHRSLLDDRTLCRS